MSTKAEMTDSATSASTLRAPLLFWAGLILFVANVTIFAAIQIAPAGKSTLYGESESGAVSSRGYKPSPFTMSSESGSSVNVKEAVKVKPILTHEPVPAVMPLQAQLDLPQASQLSLPRTSPPMALRP